ncbi:MAG TPA: inositol-3-phosphate synthase [Candidatus Binataceae bacterium]|nr:inositol-3-phosphate synthase [Candidatus Binataceae bacterium]
MSKIRLAIVGVGNCASSLLQGLEHYKQASVADLQKPIGLMHYDLGGYRPADLEVACAFDVDARKVGRPLDEACFALPNNTVRIWPDLPHCGVNVEMGEIHDGIAPHMANYPPERTFIAAKDRPVDIEKRLRDSGAEVMLCYLPVGSQKAVERYARACLETGVSLLNCMPVFIVSNDKWAAEFTERKIPVVGDDVKSQLGSTILHRAIMKLFADRGIKLRHTYQLNTGGNTDFLNMLDRARLGSKRKSKTEAVQSVLPERMPDVDVHIGPSDYIPWQNDNKVCFLRIEGEGFAGIPIELELRMSVQDSPNSGGVVIDAIRCLKLARDRKIGGPLYSIAAYTMKHPPRQIADDIARDRVEKFISGELER